jgi:hypothetical protein
LPPADAANAGAADVLGRQYSPPLAVAPLLLWQLLLLLLLPWGVGVCVGVRCRCRHHCHGEYLVVIVAELNNFSNFCLFATFDSLKCSCKLQLD